MSLAYDELHSRAAIPIKAPALISVIALMIDNDENKEKTLKIVKDLLNEYKKTNEKNKNENYEINWCKLEDLSIDSISLDDFRHKKCVKKNGKNHCILQKHTSFFVIKFFKCKEDKDEVVDGKLNKDGSLMVSVEYGFLGQDQHTKSVPPISKSTGLSYELPLNQLPPQETVKNHKDKNGKKFDWSAIDHNIEQIIDIKNNKDVIFKTHVCIETLDTNESKKDYHLSETFNDEKIKDAFIDLMCSTVSDGGAVIWTPFNSNDYDGFNKILIRDISLVPARLGRLVNRIIDIDLYSVLALQDIKEAEKQIIQLNKIENDITTMMDNIYDAANKNKISTGDYQIYCHETFKAATNTIQKVSKKRDKFQQAVSYAKIVWRRVEELREERFEGYTRIGFFLERRLRPCIRTCEIALSAQKAVSQEIQGAASLLQAGLSLEIQEQEGKSLYQNNKILINVERIMDKQNTIEKKERKFRKIVEFLAIFPITYYVSSISYKIFCENHLIFVFTVIITLVLTFFILFTDPGRKIIEKLLNYFDSSEKNS